jgi:hypothetical protein
MSEDTHGVIGRGLLSTPDITGRNEETSVLPGESTGLPKATGRVPERLPLSGEVAEFSGNA